MGLFRLSVVSGDEAAAASVANIVAFVGPLPGATVGTVYQLDPGDDIVAVTGAVGGDVLDDLENHLKAGHKCLICPSTITQGTLGSVTKVGSGPNITAALASGVAGPYATLSFKGKITKGGAANVAVLSYNLDGGSAYPYDVIVPDEGSAVLRGTVDLSVQTYPWSALNGTTLIFTLPSGTLTFGSAPTSAQDVVDDFNTLAIAAPLAVRARLAEDSTGQYMEIYSTSKGTGVTLTIDAASTGEALLGFSSGASNLTTVGTAAKVSLPYTGIELTFVSGTYVLNNTYTWAASGPSSAQSALELAADALRAQFYDVTGSGFAILVPAVVPSTAPNAQALEAGLATKLAGWIADQVNTPAVVYGAVGTSFHTTSATPATNATNINTNDAAVLAAWAGKAATHMTAVHGDVYRTGTRLKGSFRRPAVMAWAYRRSAMSLSADPGEGVQAVPNMTLIHPDGVTFARFENDVRLATKMAGYKGPGFVVSRSTTSGKYALDVGVTRAGNGNRYSKIGALASVYYLLQQMLPNLQRERVRRFDLQASGAMTDEEHASIETRLSSDASDLLRDPEDSHASSVRVTVDGTEKLVDTDNITVTYEVQPFGYPETITVIAKLTGVIQAASLSLAAA